MIKWIETLRYKWLEHKAQKAKSVYLVACWAHWGIREYKWAGKFVWDKYCGDEVPMVYYWDDHNGTKETWDVRKITHTTTGWIFAWTFDRSRAEAMVERLEQECQ